MAGMLKVTVLVELYTMALTSPAGVTDIIGGLSLIPLTATTMIAGSLQ